MKEAEFFWYLIELRSLLSNNLDCLILLPPSIARAGNVGGVIGLEVIKNSRSRFF